MASCSLKFFMKFTVTRFSFSAHFTVSSASSPLASFSATLNDQTRQIKTLTMRNFPNEFVAALLLSQFRVIFQCYEVAKSQSNCCLFSPARWVTPHKQRASTMNASSGEQQLTLSFTTITKKNFLPMLFTTVVFAHHSSAGVTLKSKLYLAINSLDELQREPESGSLKNNLIGYIRRAREEGGDEERKIITIFHFSYQDDANVSSSQNLSQSPVTDSYSSCPSRGSWAWVCFRCLWLCDEIKVQQWVSWDHLALAHLSPLCVFMTRQHNNVVSTVLSSSRFSLSLNFFSSRELLCFSIIFIHAVFLHEFFPPSCGCC